MPHDESDTLALDAVRALTTTYKLTFPIVVMTDRMGWEERVELMKVGSTDIFYLSSGRDLRAVADGLLARWRTPVSSCGSVAIDNRALTAKLGGKLFNSWPQEVVLLRHLVDNPAGLSSRDLCALMYPHEEFGDGDPSQLIDDFMSNIEKKAVDVGEPHPVVRRGDRYQIRGCMSP